MKKTICILTVLCLAGHSQSFAQYSFGIGTGLSMNNAWLGYSINKKFVPFMGLKIISMNADFSSKGFEYDFDLEQLVPFENSAEIALQAIVPTLGVKYFFKEKEKVKTYGILTFNKPIISGKIKLDGDTQDEIEDAIKKTKLFGAVLGFGGEYFFDQQFSIGAEFGLRMYTAKYKDAVENFITTPNGPVTESMTNKFTLGINPTYAKFTVNFYL
jgi:hypothetical protein